METDDLSVVLVEDLLPLLYGPLEEVSSKFEALQVKFSADYKDLRIQETAQEEIGGEVYSAVALVGVPNYSVETTERIKQVKELLSLLPKEAVQEVLQGLG